MNTSPKSGSRKRIFRNSPSASRWKWIICPATRIGFANSPRGIRGIISSARVHYVSDSWDIDNPAKLSEWKKRDAFEVWSVYFERLTHGGGIKIVRNHRPRGFAEKIRHPPGAGLHAALRKISERRDKSRLRHRTEHRRSAERLQRNLSEPRKSSSSRFKKVCRSRLAPMPMRRAKSG